MGPNAFYVFVRYDQYKERFEAFLESADAVIKQIEENLKDDRALNPKRKEFPCWGLPKSVQEQERLANNWRTWRP
jgi:hypothetical protein